MINIKLIQTGTELDGFERLEPYTGCGLINYYYNRNSNITLIGDGESQKVYTGADAMLALGWRAEVMLQCIESNKAWSDVFSY